MQPEHLAALKGLLSRQSVLSLAVMVDGEPVIGLLPFACSPDFSALIVHASGLARHTRGLRDGAPFDALVHASESPDLDPLQIPRATFQGHVKALPDEGPALDAARKAYRDRLPSAIAHGCPAICPDDHHKLEVGFPVYDVLRARCQAKAEGRLL